MTVMMRGDDELQQCNIIAQSEKAQISVIAVPPYAERNRRYAHISFECSRNA